MLPTATRSITESDAGRSTSTPRSVIASQRPEVSSFGFARTGIEDRRTRLALALQTLLEINLGIAHMFQGE